MSNASYDSSMTCDRPLDIAVQQAIGMVIYSSHIERILSLLLVSLISILIALGQMSVILTIVYTNTLREMPHFFVLICLCIGDLLLMLSTTPMYIWQFIMGCIPISVCQMSSVISETVGSGLAAHTAYMAFERYVFFCYPIRYERIFSVSKIVIILGGIYSFSLTCNAVINISVSRQYHAAVMICVLPDSHRQWGVIRNLLIMLSSTTMILYSLIKIARLMKTCQVAPSNASDTPGVSAPTDQADPIARAGPILPIQQAKKSFRMILLVSGAFCCTYFPAFVCATALFASGLTRDDLDSRQVCPTCSMMLRLAMFAVSSLSTLLNPIIYFYSRRDLRMAFLKLTRVQSNTVNPQ